VRKGFSTIKPKTKSANHPPTPTRPFAVAATLVAVGDFVTLPEWAGVGEVDEEGAGMAGGGPPQETPGAEIVGRGDFGGAAGEAVAGLAVVRLVLEVWPTFPAAAPTPFAQEEFAVRPSGDDFTH
jgi:hypothetical protein